MNIFLINNNLYLLFFQFVGSNVVSPKYNILNSYNISNNYSRQETNGSENNMNYNKHGKYA